MIVSSFNGSCSVKILRSCAKLYCEIWKEPPWNEYFWTVDGVTEDLKRQVNMSGAKGFFATNDGEVVGFTWGYLTTQSAMRNISESESLDFLFSDIECVFYLAELGVCRSFREHKIGEKLTVALLGELAKDGTRLVVLRTDIKANAARRLYQKIGFTDLMVKDGKHEDRTYWVLPLKPA